MTTAADLTMTVGGTTIDALADGLTGVSVPIDTAEYSYVSGGIEITENAGGSTVSGSFTVTRNSKTIPLFLGKSGTKYSIDLTDGTSNILDGASCVCLVAEVARPRDRAAFQVSFTVDGNPL